VTAACDQLHDRDHLLTDCRRFLRHSNVRDADPHCERLLDCCRDQPLHPVVHPQPRSLRQCVSIMFSRIGFSGIAMDDDQHPVNGIIVSI
jgi:hypothetical protein